MKLRNTTPAAPVSTHLTTALEKALLRIKQGGLKLAQGAAMASAVGFVSGPILMGCEGAADPGVDNAAGPELPGGEAGKADWAQYEGERNAQMVSYMGGSWHQLYDCNNRGGCMGVDVFIKVRVQPVQGASLEKKRVGVVYRNVSEGYDKTALGSYHSTLADGSEEWHVKVTERAWSLGAMTFNAWYQDGAGRTFYDDNEGEFHAIAPRGAYQVVNHDWWGTDLKVSDEGVKGSLSITVADLDYDKQMAIIFTTDDWETVEEMGMGAAGDDNALYWVEDSWAGHERWQVEVNLARQGVETFQYAIVYKHGVKGKATRYDFWDNNGGNNYTVRR